MARPSKSNPYGSFDANDHPIHSAVPRANYEQKKMRRDWDRADGGKGEAFNDGWDRIWGKKDGDDEETDRRDGKDKGS
jgi:hypothetical protein